MPTEKLIRHRITGLKTRVAEPHEKLDFLTDKLLETVAGFLAYRGPMALIEVSEVVVALREHFGAPEFDARMMSVWLEQGGFTKGIVQITED
jgi:predicted house-cleaning noncanonical NTP pyrophosphatase (MazG superfamily)